MVASSRQWAEYGTISCAPRSPNSLPNGRKPQQRINLNLANQFCCYLGAVNLKRTSRVPGLWVQFNKVHEICLGSPVTLEIVFGVTHGSTVGPQPVSATECRDMITRVTMLLVWVTHLTNLELTRLMARRLQSPEQEPTRGTAPAAHTGVNTRRERGLALGDMWRPALIVNP